MFRITRAVTSGAALLLALTAVSVSANAAAAKTPARTSVLGSFKTPQDGTLITGNGHRSLYILTADKKTTTAHNKRSSCYGPCAAVWPPVLASQMPNTTGLAKKSLIGLTTRKGGMKQVTYNGLPLYYYVADAKAGQSVGNHLKDQFGLWIGMMPSGKLAPDGAN